MNQEIRSKLDRICNILWGGGLAVPTLFVEQISYLIYLKLLDEREAELEVKARLLKGKGNGKPLFPDQAVIGGATGGSRAGRTCATSSGTRSFPTWLRC
jgi:type I restriction enzyme M protein